jgi:hypothetical protein
MGNLLNLFAFSSEPSRLPTLEDVKKFQFEKECENAHNYHNNLKLARAQCTESIRLNPVFPHHITLYYDADVISHLAFEWNTNPGFCASYTKVTSSNTFSNCGQHMLTIDRKQCAYNVKNDS